ncbi:MAG TPA: hypothetical protein DCS91_10295 [Microcoleaceae bacterium UBA11344]|jgi:hypothetical protein|nr:hypothetical protein [Microcoleaceae cyanobacterium UBA11344]
MPSDKYRVSNSQFRVFYGQLSSFDTVQTAGFRGAIARCCPEVLQQLQYQSVDLVLLCDRDAPSPSAILPALSNLRPTGKVPILVLDDRCIATL